MSLEVSIIVHDARWKTKLRPYTKTVRAACEAAMKGGLGIRDWGLGEVSVVLADDKFIRELNKTYRGKDKPTNVLSFPQSPIPNPQSPLGDIILAFETIDKEAAEQKKTFKAHATHMIVHGFLHLLGHDHERDKDAQAMENTEIKILKKLGVKNPYL